MTRRNEEDQGTNSVLEFPASQIDPSASRRSMLLATLSAEMLSILRDSALRKSVGENHGANHEEIEEILRAPELRARIAAGVQSFAMERLPAAIKNFYEALDNKESWAYRILLESVGFAGLAGGALEMERERPEVAISDAFERDIVERMLRRMRGARAAKPEQPSPPKE